MFCCGGLRSTSCGNQTRFFSLILCIIPKGDWAIVSIDGVITRVKITHKNRGRYVIVEDSKDGKYVNRIIDASDIMQVEK